MKLEFCVIFFFVFAVLLVLFFSKVDWTSLFGIGMFVLTVLWRSVKLFSIFFNSAFSVFS